MKTYCQKIKKSFFLIANHANGSGVDSQLHLFCMNLSLQAVRYVERQMASRFCSPVAKRKKKMNSTSISNHNRSDDTYSLQNESWDLFIHIHTQIRIKKGQIRPACASDRRNHVKFTSRFSGHTHRAP